MSANGDCELEDQGFGQGLTRVQDWGEEAEGGVVFGIRLKRVRYHSCGSSDTSHLNYATTKVRTVKAGHLKSLVAYLCPSEGSVEPSFLSVFVSTYPTFTTQEELLDLLIERYKVVKSYLTDEKGNSHDVTDVEQEKVKTTCRNVISFIKLWVDQHYDGFKRPPHLPALTKLIDFLRSHLSQEEQLLSSVERLLARFQEELSDGSPQTCSTSQHREFTVSTLHHQLFAECVTHLAAKLFKAVKAEECISFLKAKQDKDIVAPSIYAMVNQFNQLTRLTIATILQATDDQNVHCCQARAKVVGQWIMIGLSCRKLKNFASLKAILSGLDSQPIHRLRKTWSCLSNEQVVYFEELLGLMTVDNNHETSRNVLQREGTAKYVEGTSEERSGKKKGSPGPTILGVVPHLGTFLQDLTYIDSAFPDLTKDGLINFEKRRKYFEVFAQIQLFQKSAANYPETFESHPAIEHWLQNAEVYSDKASYDFSVVLEPDEGTETPEGSGPVFQSQSSLRKLYSRITSRGGVEFGNTPAVSHPGGTDTVQRERFHSHSGCIDDSREVEDDIFIIRVAFHGTQDQCNYKSLKLKKTDNTSTVVKLTLEKHGLEDLPPVDYELYQLLNDGGRIAIPTNSPVFYAMKSKESNYNFILEPKSPKH